MKMNQTAMILVGLVAGTVTGAISPELGAMVSPIGNIFMSLIFMMIAPLIFVAGVNATASLSKGKDAIKMSGITLSMFLKTAAISAVAALLVGQGMGVGTGLEGTLVSLNKAGALAADTQINDVVAMSIGGVFESFVPSNVFLALGAGEVIQILVFAMLFGFGIRQVGGTMLTEFAEKSGDVMTWMISQVIKLTPIGVFALMASATGQYGTEVILGAGGSFIAAYVAILGFIMFVMNPIIIKLFSNLTVREFFSKWKRPAAFSFTTASSMATVPVTLEAAKEMGISSKVRNLVVPMGATLNMTGNAALYSLMAVLCANLGGIELGATQYAIILAFSIFGAVGTAGVPGVAAFGVVYSMLAAAGITPAAPEMVALGMGLVIAIDRINDMMRTTVNITGDLVTAAVVDKYSK